MCRAAPAMTVSHCRWQLRQSTCGLVTMAPASHAEGRQSRSWPGVDRPPCPTRAGWAEYAQWSQCTPKAQLVHRHSGAYTQRGAVAHSGGHNGATVGLRGETQAPLAPLAPQPHRCTGAPGTQGHPGPPQWHPRVGLHWHTHTSPTGGVGALGLWGLRSQCDQSEFNHISR